MNTFKSKRNEEAADGSLGKSGFAQVLADRLAGMRRGFAKTDKRMLVCAIFGAINEDNKALFSLGSRECALIRP